MIVLSCLAALRAILSYQRRPSSMKLGKDTSHSFNESAQGLSLHEDNV